MRREGTIGEGHGFDTVQRVPLQNRFGIEEWTQYSRQLVELRQQAAMSANKLTLTANRHTRHALFFI